MENFHFIRKILEMLLNGQFLRISANQFYNVEDPVKDETCHAEVATKERFHLVDNIIENS